MSGVDNDTPPSSEENGDEGKALLNENGDEEKLPVDQKKEESWQALMIQNQAALMLAMEKLTKITIQFQESIQMNLTAQSHPSSERLEDHENQQPNQETKTPEMTTPQTTSPEVVQTTVQNPVNQKRKARLL